MYAYVSQVSINSNLIKYIWHCTTRKISDISAKMVFVIGIQNTTQKFAIDEESMSIERSTGSLYCMHNAQYNSGHDMVENIGWE